jgi:hypothetical protein
MAKTRTPRCPARRLLYNVRMGLVRFCALFVCACAAVALAQDPVPVDVQYSPLGIPCDPDQPNPDGTGIPLPCEPVDRQGILVFVRSADDTVVGFRITVHYTTAGGDDQTAMATVAREESSDWTTNAFRIGRMQTPTLTGITIVSVDAEPLATLDGDS